MIIDAKIIIPIDISIYVHSINVINRKKLNVMPVNSSYPIMM